MKLIHSKVEYIPQQLGLDGIYKQIERCGRTCYKSEDKTTENSAKSFVQRMISNKHLAMLEHGTVYLKVSEAYAEKDNKDIFPSGMAVSTEMYPWLNTPYCKINTVKSTEYSNVYDAYITTNLRYIWEKELGDLQGIHNEFLIHMCEPTEYHEKRYTLKFITDRGISHELVRHRVFSFAQESQRYCNYSKDKFGGEIQFLLPNGTGQFAYHLLMTAVYEKAEKTYLDLVKRGCPPQEARAVLPNATKTEVIMTGFASDWRHFFDLRLFEKTGKVHPDMINLTQKAQAELQKAGVWEDIIKHPSKFE